MSIILGRFTLGLPFAFLVIRLVDELSHWIILF